MDRLRRAAFLLLVIICFVLTCLPIHGAEPPNDTGYPLPATRVAQSAGISGPDMGSSETLSAVIYPFQAATVGTEVRGIVDLINYKEGDRIAKDAVVAEVSKSRYQAIVGEFEGNYEAIVRTLKRAREELAIQEETFAKRASTYDDLLKARAQVLILEARQDEAKFKLKQAEINLKACVIVAPFSGSLAVLYHQPFETVDNLEKIYEIIDTSKVYARVNWPESRLSELAPGKRAMFRYGGADYEGVIEKISSLIDPASKSKRVHVLLQNPQGKLQVGMSGTLSLTGQKKVSSRATVDGE